MSVADSQIRYDVGSPIESRLDDNGYLRVSGVLAKEGVYTYRNTDGTVRRELVTADVLNNDQANRQLHGLPVTVQHPKENLVTPNTSRIHSKGSTVSVNYGAGKLSVDLIVTDSAGIKAVESGVDQLSPGYRVELSPVPGMWNGQPYDAIQLKRFYNHVALVDSARGGSECRLNLDGFAVDNEGACEMAKVTLPNGTVVNVDDASTASAIQDALSARRDADEDTVSKNKFDALQEKFDELKGKMDEAEKAKADAEEDKKGDEDEDKKADMEEKADAAMAARIDSMFDVIDKARQIKPNIEIRKDGKLKSATEIMAEALEAAVSGDSIRRQRNVNADSADSGLTAVQKAHARFYNGGK